MVTMRARAAVLLLLMSSVVSCSAATSARSSPCNLQYKTGSSNDNSNSPQLPGPPAYDDASLTKWHKAMKDGRAAELDLINYKGGVFSDSRLKWTQSAVSIPMVQGYDRYLYDPVAESYTPEKYLADVRQRYGGVDTILLWVSYMSMGLDDRNQFDLYRAMPGGLEGIRNLTSAFHAEGVRVIWGYNPWDTGTRREPGFANVSYSDPLNLARLLAHTGGDGINGDTLTFVPYSFWQAGEDAGFAMALQPEGGNKVAALNWTTMGVCHCNYEPMKASVDHYKWLDSRYMTSVRDRWSPDHTDALQHAWFNGVGYESTENDWGAWYAISANNAEALRRTQALQRFFIKRGTLVSPDWLPHVPGTEAGSGVTPGLFASKFPNRRRPNGRSGETLWTFVNRANRDYNSTRFVLPSDVPMDAQLWDCWRGRRVKRRERDGAVPLNVAARGYGCLLAVNSSGAATIGEKIRRNTKTQNHGHNHSKHIYDGQVREDSDQEVDASLLALMAQMANWTLQGGPLNRYSRDQPMLRQRVTPRARTHAYASSPPGTVAIPARAQGWHFVVSGVEDQGYDAQFWPEASNVAQNKAHAFDTPIEAFYIHRYPVTRANYSTYLNATGYVPRDTHNWLRDWEWGGTMGSGTPRCAPHCNAPVTAISYNEAESYCQWTGGRLPHDWEWQFAAQGDDGRPYPWGDNGTICRGGRRDCSPTLVINNTTPLPTDVMKYSPQSDSAFGVSDLVGGVWEFTSEFTDEHNRGSLVRGSSNYLPGINGTRGSHWYYPEARRLDSHSRYMLLSDSYERATMLGFRCVFDAEDKAKGDTRGGNGSEGGSSVDSSIISKSSENTSHFNMVVSDAHTSSATASRRRAAVYGSKWAGPPFAHTNLDDVTGPGASNPSEWAMWAILSSEDATSGAATAHDTAGNKTPVLSTVRSFAASSAPRIGTPVSLCHSHQRNGSTIPLVSGRTRVLALSWRNGVPSNGSAAGPASDVTAGIASQCADGSSGGGFRLGVRASGVIETLTLYGGGQGNSSVAVTIADRSSVESSARRRPKISKSEVAAAAAAAVAATTTYTTINDQDATIHVTFHAAAGALVEVLWQTGNATACSGGSGGGGGEKEFVEIKGRNCFRGHGATEIDDLPVLKSATPVECMVRCEADESCTAVVFRPTGGWCWRRKDIQLGKCVRGDAFDLYVLKGSLRGGAPGLYAAVLTPGLAPELPGYLPAASSLRNVSGH